MELPARPFLVRHPLEHPLHDRPSDGVDDGVTALGGILLPRVLVDVSRRRDAGPESHLAAGPEASLHVHSSVIILEFRLAPEDHEEELLVWVVSKALAVCAYLLEYARVHEVDDLAEVACVARDTVRCPGEDAVELASLQLFDDLVEDRPLARLFSGVALALQLYDLESLAVGELEHFLDLAIDAQNLPFLALGRFAGIEAVSDPHRGLYWLGREPDRYLCRLHTTQGMTPILEGVQTQCV